MISINIKNIDELILKNSEAKKLLPDLRPFFDKWLLSYRFPGLNNLRKEAMMDLLNSLDGSHIEKLAKLFGDMVFIENVDYHIVKNINFPIGESIEVELTKHDSYTNMALSRNADQFYITLWR